MCLMRRLSCLGTVTLPLSPLAFLSLRPCLHARLMRGGLQLVLRARLRFSSSPPPAFSASFSLRALRASCPRPSFSVSSSLLRPRAAARMTAAASCGCHPLHATRLAPSLGRRLLTRTASTLPSQRLTVAGCVTRCPPTTSFFRADGYRLARTTTRRMCRGSQSAASS